MKNNFEKQKKKLNNQQESESKKKIEEKFQQSVCQNKKTKTDEK